ncbi:MAG TPA: hypothetical protein ENK44_03755 [Caldithrix abyssi]|uniref:Uncharacterized protein n=1 Tax=Caldithrix abyssi TaxID=187145 RepID=A0A7V4WUY2_CALAY|nr:hypothetical protein [Caldithrix abyssi]
MNFLDFKDNLESKLKKKFKFELWELSYTPYSFGSGVIVYRINGKFIKYIFDGKDNILELHISGKHKKYSECKFNFLKSYANLNSFEIKDVENNS